MSESCATCRFSRSDWPGRDPGLGEMSRCQRYAPHCWRVIEPQEWCGEYEPVPQPVPDGLRVFQGPSLHHIVCDGRLHDRLVHSGLPHEPCDCARHQEANPS